MTEPVYIITLPEIPDFTFETGLGPTGPRGADGADGRDGRDGTDGATPERGVDYWTAEDQREIVDAVTAQTLTASVSGETLVLAVPGSAGGD